MCICTHLECRKIDRWTEDSSGFAGLQHLMMRMYGHHSRHSSKQNEFRVARASSGPPSTHNNGLNPETKCVWAIIVGTSALLNLWTGDLGNATGLEIIVASFTPLPSLNSGIRQKSDMH